MRFHSDLRSVIGWTEGHMTFEVRFLEITISYHRDTMTYYNITMTIYHDLPWHTTTGMNRLHGDEQRAVKQLCSLNGKKKAWNHTFSLGLEQFGGFWLAEKQSHMV